MLKLKYQTAARIAASLITGLSLIGATQPAVPKLAGMPAELETRFALSAVPPALRADASVYLLNPKTGYRLARRGNSGISCLVQRTAWELNDLRDDIYYPLCFDQEGSQTYLKVILDSASLRANGLTAAALTALVKSRYADKTYRPAAKPGLSYMVGPVMRTISPDRTVQTMTMPHLMFYAPGLTNEDVGAKPNPSDFSTLMNPFVDTQGNAEQSFLIQMIGATEKAKILADEKSLVDDLCAFRHILCLTNTGH
jgi:hypothetical protein